MRRSQLFLAIPFLLSANTVVIAREHVLQPSPKLTISQAAEIIQNAIDIASKSENLPHGFSFESAKVSLETSLEDQGNGEVDVIVNVGGSITPNDTQTVDFTLVPNTTAALGIEQMPQELADSIIATAKQLTEVRAKNLAVKDFTITRAVKVTTVVQLGVTIPFLGIASVKLGGQRTTEHAGTVALTYTQH